MRVVHSVQRTGVPPLENPQAVQYWTPPRHWEGQDAFLIGGGPSLRHFNLKSLAGRNVIGCNDAVWLGKDIVSYGAFGDMGWFCRNRQELERLQMQTVTNSTGLFGKRSITWLHRMRRQADGIGTGNILGWNFSTGAMAINLACSLGASRIFLLGYDLSNKEQVSHWHDRNKKLIADTSFARYMRGFAMVAKCLPANIRVLNVTDGSSKLTVFPRISFEDLNTILYGHHQENATTESRLVAA